MMAAAWGALAWQIYHRHLTFSLHSLSGMIYSPLTWGITLLLAGANWWLRIYKWQQMASTVHPVSFRNAACQILKTYAWSAVTPFNSGEMLAKPVFFPARRKQLFLTASWEQLSQMTITLIMGLGTLWIHGKELMAALAGVTIIRGMRGKMFGLALWLSWWRYLIFGTLMVIMLVLHAQIPWSMAWTGVPLYYLGVSLLPVLSWGEWAVKANIALLVFPHAPADILLAIVLWLWCWQSLLPMLAGLFLLIRKQQCGYVD